MSRIRFKNKINTVVCVEWGGERILNDLPFSFNLCPE